MIPEVMETTVIATSTDEFRPRQIIHFTNLPPVPSGSGITPGIVPPGWMGPEKYSDAKVRKVEGIVRRPAHPVNSAVFGP